MLSFERGGGRFRRVYSRGSRGNRGDSGLAPYHPSGQKKGAAAIKPLLNRSGLHRSNELTTFPRFRVSRRSSTQYVLLLRKSFYSGVFICHTNYGLVIDGLDRLKLSKRSSDETNENGLTRRQRIRSTLALPSRFPELILTVYTEAIDDHKKVDHNGRHNQRSPN
jgi:hypothetical protein